MTRGIGHRLLALGAACIVLSLPAAATTIGVAPAGPVASGTGAGGYVREWVQLDRVGGLLIGFPETGPARALAIHAPAPLEASLILRWNEREDGKTSLLLAAPEELAMATRRVTLYLASSSSPLSLFERIGETWFRRDGNRVELAEPLSEDSPKHLTAFITSGLGPFWLVDDSVPISDASDGILPATNPLIEGSITRAVTNWILPVVMLVIAWSAARLRHRRESSS